MLNKDLFGNHIVSYSRPKKQIQEIATKLFMQMDSFMS